ncbi:ABC transporter permease/M1 family aminopeptidase [Aquabacterium humicola]|uniref:ABC transporter permease/M1 family aminopeptidase n=1 Tax=Aquabacterium humicola TaxID=3237377 RepID=UPI002542938F|nr:M1 family aminopeptidase [Rubrivivax pictus]
MFRHIAAFEWRYQLKSPVFWVGCLIFFLLTFGATTIEQIQIGSRGNVNVNAPYAILQTLAVMSLFAVFVTVAMVANVVIRDDETGFAPILRSTSVSKGAYLGGRFVGASAAAFLVLCTIPLAIALGTLMPWLDAEKIGPWRWADYLWPLFVFALPTLLITAAAFFALATATRSMMWTYVGTVGLLVLYFVTSVLLRDPRHDAVAALVDPFGMSVLRITTRYWTAAERNSQLPALAGLLLANRVLWTGIALALFALAYRLFRFEGRTQRSVTAAAADDDASTAARLARLADAQRGPVALPSPRSDGATRRAQAWALARFDMAFVFRSPAFFVLLAIGLLNAGASLWFDGELYGSPSWPVTRLMVQALNNAYTIMPVIIAIYYGGELVWRDRERRMHEIVDATAAPDWAHLVPKIIAIALVLLATAAVGALAGIVVQTIKGFHRYQLDAYVLWFVLPTAIGALQLAVLSVFVQVLVPQKFLGWGAMLVFLVASISLGNAGFEHVLYNYGATTPVPLSDMNGLGRFWIGAAWTQVYWSAFALVLTVFAYALWRRGATIALRPRLAQLTRRLRGRALIVLGGALAVWAGSGAWIFFNTNVLNRYRPEPEQEALLAEAEKTLLKFETVAQPTITAVTLDVDLHPREARAITRGRYVIENRTAAAIDTLHLAWVPALKLDAVELDGARLEQEWPTLHYRIYRLAQPMQPGERRTLGFTTTLEERGFPNRAPLTRIVANGSFLDNTEITPFIGASREALLKDRSKRRKHGLPPDLRPPTLEDDSGRARTLFRPDSGFVTLEMSVTTDADQTPIAPGTTLSDTVTGGRRTVRFKPDAPIEHFYSIQSARYAVRRDSWRPTGSANPQAPQASPGQDVQLAVYYHEAHPYNVDRMLAAMKLSLQVFSEQFSPYQFQQARILEFPAYADFAQSFANTIPYSETIGFIHRQVDPEKIDMVSYVTAHEIAHQWWGHQLVPAYQQGATMLVETFAQYSALLVMERLYGPEQIRRFLKYELDRYLRARGGEVVEELPLARVENQPYIHYNKGSLAMYWLKERVGEPALNRALSKFLAQHAFKAAPYPNTRDFLALLRAEAGPQHDALITDLFEKITLLDLKTVSAIKRPREDRRWELELVIEAHKRYADGLGKETDAPLQDEPVEIGVFAAEPGKAGFGPAAVLSLAVQPLRSGRQTFNLVLDREPQWAGVDPYNKRIDRLSDDNLKAVERR